jgi:hypothetical protein
MINHHPQQDYVNGDFAFWLKSLVSVLTLMLVVTVHLRYMVHLQVSEMMRLKHPVLHAALKLYSVLLYSCPPELSIYTVYTVYTVLYWYSCTAALTPREAT